MSVGVLAGEPVLVEPCEGRAGVAAPGTLASPGAMGAPGRLGAEDLAEILSRFSQASDALQRTHETLQAEVARLTRELGEANEELQRSRRLAALGEIAAGIAHEVRNPLASIALDARMLAAEVAERAEARAAAERIGASVRGLDRVVGDVLCFARELRPRAEAVEASELIERAIGECGAFACAAGVELAGMESEGSDGSGGADEGANRGVIICCDPELAHRALTNLVRNAIEAVSERGGVVERRVVVGCERRGAAGRGRRGEAALRVRDTGPGIAPGVLDRMFNPFFTTRAAGTGLGLAIVHRIMDAHGGRVEAWNNADVRASVIDVARCVGAGIEGGGSRGGGTGSPGCGATFEIVFPEPSVRGRPRRAAMEKDR